MWPCWSATEGRLWGFKSPCQYWVSAPACRSGCSMVLRQHHVCCHAFCRDDNGLTLWNRKQAPNFISTALVMVSLHCSYLLPTKINLLLEWIQDIEKKNHLYIILKKKISKCHILCVCVCIYIYHKTGFKLRDLTVSDSQVLGLKMYVIMSSMNIHVYIYTYSLTFKNGGMSQQDNPAGKSAWHTHLMI